MRLLLDNNLSPRSVEPQSDAGWTIVHVAELGLQQDGRIRLGCLVVVGEDSRRIRRLPIGGS